jgi:Zn-dependent protease with chaperone function
MTQDRYNAPRRFPEWIGDHVDWAVRTVLFIVFGLAMLTSDARGEPSTPDVATAVASNETVQAGDPYTVTVTEEMRSHQRWRDTLYFASFIYGVLLLAAIFVLGISRRLRDVALRITQRPVLSAMVYCGLFIVLTAVLSAPFDCVSDFLVPHRFGLSNQTFAAWVWEVVKATLLTLAMGAPILALALAGIRRVKRWWLALWAASVPFAAFFILIAPVALDPVFNDFKPLADGELRTGILGLASRAGISEARVFQVDKSKQTKTMNAYVTGLGPTRRIVLWDTIIAKMDRDELLFVMGHEMGHYVLHHIWKMFGIMLGATFVAFYLVQRTTGWIIARCGERWGFSSAGDPAALPVLLLCLNVLGFLASPVSSGISRYFERQSDVFALELTHLNDAGARAFVKFAEDGKKLPDPHPFILFWRYGHPSLSDRIAFARRYKPWETGEPNRLWKDSWDTKPSAKGMK